MPDPVCHTDNGKCLSYLPDKTNLDAPTIAADNLLLNIFCLELTLAHDSLIIANALIISIGIIWLPILKFLSDLCVCAPQKFSLETAILPILSCSIRFFLLINKVLYYLLTKHGRNVLNFKKL